MIRSYFYSFLIFIFIWCGCKDDDQPTSSFHSTKELVGSWELKASEPASYAYWKYLILTSGNYYYQLISLQNDLHDISQGVFSVTGNQIDFSSLLGLFNFNISNDTLKMSTPDYTLIFVKTNNAPDKEEWIIPVKVLKEITLPEVLIPMDLTYDGTNFWLTDIHKDVIKIDSLGNILASYSISNGGIAYGNKYLWVSDTDTLKIIDPLNGEIVSTKELQPGYYYLSSLGYESGYLWGSGGSKIVKIQEETGIITNTMELFSDHIDFQEGKIWAVLNNYICSVDTSSAKVINTYDIQDYLGYINALSFDGNYYWAGFYKIGTDTYSLLKLDIK